MIELMVCPWCESEEFEEVCEFKMVDGVELGPFTWYECGDCGREFQRPEHILVEERLEADLDRMAEAMREYYMTVDEAFEAFWNASQVDEIDDVPDVGFGMG